MYIHTGYTFMRCIIVYTYIRALVVTNEPLYQSLRVIYGGMEGRAGRYPLAIEVLTRQGATVTVIK